MLHNLRLAPASPAATQQATASRTLGVLAAYAIEYRRALASAARAERLGHDLARAAAELKPVTRETK